MKKLSLFIFVLAFIIGCAPKTNKKADATLQIETHQAISLLGKDLIIPQLDATKDAEIIDKYLNAKDYYEKNMNDPEALIWMGRRMAYLGDMKKSIEIFTEGIKKFPEDARMYRHRGHRNLNLRNFDKAIEDFNIAIKLIEGTEDSIEPDGAPNIRNIPVSSLHTNIWYHLGLAHYLENDMEKAYWAFNESLKASKNPDMLAASTNWVYMILRRMGNEDEAIKVLEPITADLDVFENVAYHKLCLFYKGKITEEELLGNRNQSVDYMNDAIIYGLGNWYYYNGNIEKAKELYTKLIKNGVWGGFAFISAEADLSRGMN